MCAYPIEEYDDFSSEREGVDGSVECLSVVEKRAVLTVMHPHTPVTVVRTIAVKSRAHREEH